MRSNCDCGLGHRGVFIGFGALVLAIALNCVEAEVVKAGQIDLAQSQKDLSAISSQASFSKSLIRREGLLAQAKDEEGTLHDSGPGPQSEGHARHRPDGMGARTWEHFGPGPLDLTPLNLTAEQKQKIQEIRQQTGIKTRDLRKTLNEKRAEMRDSMFNPTISQARLREKHREMTRLHQKAEDAIFEDFLSIRALLTPEQKKHLPEVKPTSKEPTTSRGFKGSQPSTGAIQAPPEVKGRNTD